MYKTNCIFILGNKIAKCIVILNCLNYIPIETKISAHVKNTIIAIKFFQPLYK